MSSEVKQKQLTTGEILRRKGGEKLVAVTAYDYTFAKIIDPLVDIVLVGDSLGMVIQGMPNTLSVTLDEMIYHSRAVSRAVQKAHLVVDMPFMSYQTSEAKALHNAGRLLQEGYAQSVKVEGGVAISRTVSRLVDIGIPVMGHVGLTPQSVHQFGGYKVQGKSPTSAEAIMMDALALEDAGAYSIVLEGIPTSLAKEISERVKIPTIGIGAGIHCDGQVLVNQDLLGMNPSFKPKFVKRYANLNQEISSAVESFAKEVRGGVFPSEEFSFGKIQKTSSPNPESKGEDAHP